MGVAEGETPNRSGWLDGGPAHHSHVFQNHICAFALKKGKINARIPILIRKERAVETAPLIYCHTIS